MAENGGRNTDDAIDDDEEKYNYYQCKYALPIVRKKRTRILCFFRLARGFTTQTLTSTAFCVLFSCEFPELPQKCVCVCVLV